MFDSAKGNSRRLVAAELFDNHKPDYWSWWVKRTAEDFPHTVALRSLLGTVCLEIGIRQGCMEYVPAK